MRDVQAVIFDLDDTLWEVGPVILRAEHAMLEFLARRYPRVLELDTLDSMRAVRARMALEHPAMRHDFTWLRLESLRHHARVAGYPDTMAQEAFDVFYRARNEVTLYDDALPALEQLHGRFRLFAISNGNADLGAIGIGRFFEHTLAAREAGVLKPDPRIFALLLERAGVSPQHALHVGDDVVADVEGARRAGLTPVWVDRAGEGWSAPTSPPLTVRSLAELVVLLG
ncbi:MAG: HAD family hydrolase [Gammaproteobacteria bacterium]|jgi:putative hydrolase of the HAD superfamily|nr:HAD family hydrolase [Gammaproteobacteria bacterium]